MTVIGFLKDFVLLHEAAPTYLICVHASAIVMSLFGGISEFYKYKNVYLNLSIQNLSMAVAVLVHLYGVSIRSTDLLLAISWVPSHIVIYCFLLEYNFPGIFALKEGIKGFRRFESRNVSATSLETSEKEKVVAPKRNLLEGADLQIIENRIDKFVQERVFLDEEIRLPDFAAYLGLTVHQASYYLNQYRKLNFPEFINFHRFEEVKRMLREKDHLGLLEIALTCGFNSTASFHRASLKFAGLTPKELRKKVQKTQLETVSG
ncbi:AraC family transcriptional regulator [Leptospira yasudae]|uniref:AraC family transcriptional regulator n=1 Tax=Leptospira yasudae TaxID=2202201 RepID=UPI0010917F3C|nr:helix-turn-helix domain-containing protein [Leptospira yasudae]TGM95395.1 AraC family transcriptional regulator [Leptospira yasudae]